MLAKLITSLIRFATSIALLPLRMLSRNFVGTIILFGLLYIFFWPKNEGTQPVKKVKLATGKQQPLPRIDPVRKTQDGNSRFSDDLLSMMAPAELKHYSDVFFWVMDNKKAGYPHRWAYYNVDGTITPFSTFKNNHGHRCRKFKETLKVHTTRQTLDGIACERPEGGWCRLRFDSTPLCGIAEKGSGIFLGVGQSLRNLF